MRVAVLCEFSGVLSDAFENRGIEAHSFDLLDTERKKGLHFKSDILKFPRSWWSEYDLIVAHPPCTYLAVSGARWFAERPEKQLEALSFVRYLMNLPVDKIAIENPVSVISTKIRKPDQIIQPWQFGHGETKATCLWLKGLPKLRPTEIVEGREKRIHNLPPSQDRWKERSRTFAGIAEAMADQWS